MKQTRFIPIATCGLQVRAGEDGQQSRTVVGTPIVFGVRSNNLTPWSSRREVYEVMEPGCISDELLRQSDVVLNLNHSNKVTDILGRFRNTENDTLKLNKNLRDIGCECDVAETSAGNDALVLIRRHDITGMSFAFEDDWEDSENGVSYERMKAEDHDGKEVWVRHVKRVTALYDVSIVTHPAYEQASVATREQSDAINDAIDAQLKREQGQHEETAEEREAREKAEREANGGETNAEKAEREAREAKEREANGGETNAEKAAREQREKEEEEQRQLEEQEQRFREQQAMRLRAQHRRREIDIESLNY